MICHLLLLGLLAVWRFRTMTFSRMLHLMARWSDEDIDQEWDYRYCG
jgi:hypothetical protein